MTAVIIAWVALSLVIGLAWIATELRSEPRGRLLVDFAIAALAWPIILGISVVLMIMTESKPHDAPSGVRGESASGDGSRGATLGPAGQPLSG